MCQTPIHVSAQMTDVTCMKPLGHCLARMAAIVQGRKDDYIFATAHRLHRYILCIDMHGRRLMPHGGAAANKLLPGYLHTASATAFQLSTELVIEHKHNGCNRSACIVQRQYLNKGPTYVLSMSSCGGNALHIRFVARQFSRHVATVSYPPLFGALECLRRGERHVCTRSRQMQSIGRVLGQVATNSMEALEPVMRRSDCDKEQTLENPLITTKQHIAEEK